MLQIIWTELAKIEYWENIEYLEKEWTLNDVYNFMDKTDDLIVLLAKKNLTFKPTNYEGVFQVPVTKQITLFYRILENKEVELLRFWNNYQEPKKIKIINRKHSFRTLF
jgi:hypothetical protein